MKTTILQLLLLIPFSLLAQQDTNKETKADVYYITEQMPEFPGGTEGYARYLMSNVRYPEEARQQGLSGKTYVSYIVDVDGSVVDVKVAKSSHPLLDEEAVRVIKSMKYDAPGYQRGKAVKVKFTQPVSFNLPAPIESDDSKKKKKRKKKDL